jgi:hypothetical protein
MPVAAGMRDREERPTIQQHIAKRGAAEGRKAHHRAHPTMSSRLRTRASDPDSANTTLAEASTIV